ncbi:pyrroloquinoline quinone precursor peptide PqqA [Xanthomonas sp. PPL568]|uniref:pyrroloquinoline quinone precursor peptide PqqA n=1 Tax=Xanthomonas indica TaxID=2912242 RepID=UPI001F56C8E9|nr:pyrroloquinoline quinone precursor peptide PqqA [Xanthomonas indica]MCI2243309.1 pyrroloquinoline quinone precursor peptide PqqA [Xanthomonas indica]
MLERDGNRMRCNRKAVLHAPLPSPPGPTRRGTHMKKWNKPVIREICVGAEINCYASGEL